MLNLFCSPRLITDLSLTSVSFYPPHIAKLYKDERGGMLKTIMQITVCSNNLIQTKGLSPFYLLKGFQVIFLFTLVCLPSWLCPD